MAQYKKKYPRLKSMHKNNAAKSGGVHCLVYIRKYPDFGDTKFVFSPVVRSDKGVNIFSRHVYGDGRKVRRRYKACRRRIVIFTSLKNNHMLAEITLHRTGTCSLHTHTSFSKDLLSRF